MKPTPKQGSQEIENDLVWDLLARDASAHPLTPSPWFATRVAASALATGQRRLSTARLLRWLIPVPLACSALVALAAWNHHQASEERFERNMELLAFTGDDLGL